VLGTSLLGQKRFAEAETYLLQGYEGMKAREARIRVPARRRLTETASQIVRLYELWGKNEKADEWRTRIKGPAKGMSRKP
jgi:hypothetical protein